MHLFMQQALGILLLYKLSNLVQYNLHPKAVTVFPYACNLLTVSAMRLQLE